MEVLHLLERELHVAVGSDDVSLHRSDWRRHNATECGHRVPGTHLGNHGGVAALQLPLELYPGLGEAAGHAGDGAVGAVQLDHVSAARLVVELVHVLRDEGGQQPRPLPPRQGAVVGVGEEAGPARPAHEVARPVALPRLAALHEHLVLHRPLGRGGVQAHVLAAVVGDPALRGDS